VARGLEPEAAESERLVRPSRKHDNLSQKIRNWGKLVG
jgi:hypothetical protein